MKSVLLLALLLAATSLLRAEDWTTVDGKTFKNVKVLSHDDGYVTIMDDDGGAKVMLTELPAPLRARFGFDPVKASACVAATEDAEAKEQAALDAEKRRRDAAATPATASVFGMPAPVAAAASVSVAKTAALAIAVPADTLLQNGDFSQGGSGWEGDGTFAPGSRSLLVKLSTDSWTRIYRDYSGDKGTIPSLTFIYRLSPGLTPSKDATLYTDIDKKLGVEGFDTFSPTNVGVGEFYATLGDPTSHRVVYEVFNPDLTSTAVSDLPAHLSVLRS